MPEWAQLPGQIRDAWIAAALKAAEGPVRLARESNALEMQPEYADHPP